MQIYFNDQISIVILPQKYILFANIWLLFCFEEILDLSVFVLIKYILYALVKKSKEHSKEISTAVLNLNLFVLANVFNVTFSHQRCRKLAAKKK